MNCLAFGEVSDDDLIKQLLLRDDGKIKRFLEKHKITLLYDRGLSDKTIAAYDIDTPHKMKRT